MAIAPTEAQLRNLAAHALDGPIYMLNLLKFKPRAEYPDGRPSDLTGAEAYDLYGQSVGPLIANVGGRLVWAGQAQTLVIGDGELQWDRVAIVEYPSLEAFREMTSSDGYGEAHVHREAGLAHQLLIHCVSMEQALAMAGGDG